MKKILLLDGNAPWVRSLFAAMNQTETHAVIVRSAAWFLGRRRWERADNGLIQTTLTVPGLTKAPRISSMMIRNVARQAIRRMGGADLIVHTFPAYAPVAEYFRGRVCQVYHAHDVFRFYEWNRANIMQLEGRLLEACDATFVVAGALGEDFRRITDRPIYDCPMAVSSDFVRKLSEQRGDPPAALGALRRPIVGCIGHINQGYDWELVGALADGMPEATFVFVGPILDEPPDVRRPREQAFSRSNVKWLGTVPHADVPRYLEGFDICLNPLAMTEHNDRRSPLRLFDYLATDRPILSTAIREAFTHGRLVECFRTADEGIALLRRMTGGTYTVDMQARTEYIRANTWEKRAEQFLLNVREVCPRLPST